MGNTFSIRWETDSLKQHEYITTQLSQVKRMIYTPQAKTKTILLVLCLLALTYGVSPQVGAVMVWSDNFNDTNYNGWTVETGAFSAADNTLRCTSEAMGVVHHPSTVASGTWSFDFLFTGSLHVSIIYFAVGVMSDLMGNQGYQITVNNYGFTLYVVTDSATTTLDSYTAPGGIQGRQHFDFTRDAGGLIRGYLNSTLVVEATNTEHTTVNYFLAHMFQDESLDNVVVSNTIDITPTTTDTGTGAGTETPPGIPGFPAAAILVGLFLSVLLVMVIRRHRPASSRE